MLKTLIEKEFRDLISSTKFIVTFGACAFLIIAAFYVGATRHRLNMVQYDASKAEVLRSLEGVTDWMDVNDNQIFLSPQPLAALVSGISNDIGRSAVIRGRGEVSTTGSRYNEDPIFAIFRFLDLEFIFQIVLSLFAILLGYNSISGEKEQGTLRLSFANPLPRKTYILGKLIGSFLSLSISIIIAVSIGVLLLPLMGIALSFSEWVRLILIIATGLLYFGVFLTLSIFVSALTQRSSNSFLLLLVIWVMCIHVVPRAAVLLAARSVEVPTVDELAHQKSILNRQLNKEHIDGMRIFDINELGPEEDVAVVLNKYIDSLNDIRDQKLQSFSRRLNEDRINHQRTQEKLAFSIARISPATSLTLASSHLAGTSLKLKNRFYDEANRYQEVFGSFKKEKTGVNTGGMLQMRKSTSCGGGGGSQDEEKTEAINARELPTFDYRQESMAESLTASLLDVGILMIYNLIFFGGAFVAFIRYDLR
jgi:ABC-type transport system involved in multi-copper enzyme maturation permease subunit